MKLDKYIAISGMPGLYTMVSSKPNGLLVRDLNEGKTKFCSLRKYEFTPLETVGIYTMTDTENLTAIFKTMKEKRDIMPDPKAPKADLLSYFGEILPSYDKDKVYPNHIIKIVKWYLELEAKGFLEEEEEASDEKTTKSTAKKKSVAKAVKPNTPKQRVAKPKAVASKKVTNRKAGKTGK